MKSRKKIYKAGKIWLTGTITIVSMGIGLGAQIDQASANVTEYTDDHGTSYYVDRDKEIADQQNMVEYAQLHVDMAQEDVNAAQAEFDKTNDIESSATPQEIADIQKSVDAVQVQLGNDRTEVDNLKSQQKNNENIMQDYNNAEDEYEQACQKEVDAQKNHDAALWAYNNAKTSEEQDTAFKLFSDSALPYADAIANRKAKEKIVAEKTSAFNIAHEQWGKNQDLLIELNSKINTEEDSLEQLKQKLSLYQNSFEEKEKAEKVLAEKQKDLQNAQNYLTEQKTKLNELKEKFANSKAQSQNQNQEGNSDNEVIVSHEKKTSDEHLEQYEQQTPAQIVKETHSANNDVIGKKVTDRKETNKKISMALGNVRLNEVNANIVEQKEVFQSKNIKTSTNSALPQTGNSDVLALTSLGVLLSMFGFGLAKKKLD